MSESTAPAPTLFNQAPGVISNGNDFYTIYGLGGTGTNHVCGTIFDSSDQTWRTTKLTNSRNPALINNGLIKTLLVGQGIGTPCVVYQSAANQISIFTFSTEGAINFRTSYTAPSGNINNFCLYTDNTYLYVITNEGGTLFSLRLNNNIIDNRFQLNGSGGKTATMNVATTPGHLSALLDSSGNLHCAFQSNAGITEIFQKDANTWSFETIVRGEGSYQGVQLFTYGGEMKVTVVYSIGGIDILKRTGSYPNDWVNDYSSPAGATSSIGPANVGINTFGLFITYADTNGALQCVYNMPNYGWNTIQLTGAAIGGSIVPNAPSANSAPGVGVYNNFCYHAIYVSGNQVYDVFWAFTWGGAQLYPAVPQSNALLQLTGSKEVEMMPTVK